MDTFTAGGSLTPERRAHIRNQWGRESGYSDIRREWRRGLSEDETAYVAELDRMFEHAFSRLTAWPTQQEKAAAR